MISSILSSAKVSHLKISTATILMGDQEWENPTKRTTLSPWQTQKLLRQAVNAGIKTAILEVSSHALVQFRLFGMEVAVAGITNVTEEHLDDHGGFANYAAAKKRLFTKYLAHHGTAVLNADDPTIASWENDIPQRKIWTSVQDKANADLAAGEISANSGKLEFVLNGGKITLPLTGEFQIANALIAIGVARSMSISEENIKTGLKNFHGTPGRLEKVEYGQNFAIYVDDALTPNAIAEGLRSLRVQTPRRLWAIFGCCGTRDKGKRPKIGKIVGELADAVVLTDDEPYTESAEEIREQVKGGVRETKLWNTENFQEIPDRAQAIRYALEQAEAGDTIFLFGMGSYTSRNIGGKEIPWSDKEVVRQILNF